MPDPVATEVATQKELSDKINALESAAKELTGERDALLKDLKGSDEQIKDLEKRLKRTEKQLREAVEALTNTKVAKIEPEDNTARVDGKTLRITGRVIAKFALDEVKKGYIEEDIELLIPERG